MGRWSYSSRNTVEDCLTLSIFSLRQDNVLWAGCLWTSTWKNRLGEERSSIGGATETGPDADLRIRLTYTQTDRISCKVKEELEYTIDLTETPCNFGNKRYWFLCPVSNCGRRVGKLYLPPRAKLFGCRMCYDLTYQSCRDSNTKFARLLKLGGGRKHWEKWLKELNT